MCTVNYELHTCIVQFGITLQDSVDKAEVYAFQQLLQTIDWFFFDLFLLGYVEDPATGQSFRFPGGMAWAVYIEVCIHIHVHSPICTCIC